MVLDTEMTDRGIVCTHKVLGTIATIERRESKKDNGMCWYVFPYPFPPYERGAEFQSLRAAEFYAVALAHEHHETKAR